MKFAILGYDELGSNLAKFFEKKGHLITSVVYLHKNISAVESQFQKVIYLPKTPEKEIEQIVSENDVFILTHSLSYEDRTQLKTIATSFLKSAKTHPNKTLIFLSSTSIYGDHKGQWVDEDSALKTEKNHHVLLNEIESFFLSLKNYEWNCCILRLANVYYSKEDLIDRFQKLTHLPLPGNGMHHTNMVHIQDVYFCIEYIVRHHLTGIYNLCDDDHSTQKEFYELLAKTFQLSLPAWKGQRSTEFDFRASNHKIKSKGFCLSQPKRL